MKHTLCYSMLQRVYALWSCLLMQVVDVDHKNTLDTLYGTCNKFGIHDMDQNSPQVIVILETTIFMILF